MSWATLGGTADRGHCVSCRKSLTSPRWQLVAAPRDADALLVVPMFGATDDAKLLCRSCRKTLRAVACVDHVVGKLDRRTAVDVICKTRALVAPILARRGPPTP